MFSATESMSLCLLSVLCHPMWGVRRREGFGPACTGGCPPPGLFHLDVNAGARDLPMSQSVAQISSFTIAPLAVLMKHALCFINANASCESTWKRSERERGREREGDEVSRPPAGRCSPWSRR